MMKPMRTMMIAVSMPLAAMAGPGGIGTAWAQDAAARRWHLPSQSLADSLRVIAIASGRSIAAPAELVAGRTAPAIDGDYSVEAAVEALLAGSGLVARPVGAGLVIAADDQAAAGLGGRSADIVVTGSRIAGAKSASSVVDIRREAMKSAGRTSVDDVLRAIPQNFSGGQNPGVGYNVPETSGVNVGGSSSVNLRGIGSDATLTLLNGHRLAYSASFQSVDISAIPFGAIDRIEIVPDGASTLYGSDAVAGVVNVILRRDASGIETSAKLGGATDGGDFLQQYGLTAGTRWNSGGLLLAYEFDRNGAVDSDQRGFSARLRPGLTLLPALQQHNVLASVHQDLAPDLTFSLDALFGRRSTDNHYPLNDAGDLAASASYLVSRTRSWSVAPSLDLALGTWSLALAGTYAANRTSYGGQNVIAGISTDAGSGYYRNIGSSAEFSATGPIATLPGGAAKAALGVGWRRNDFLRFTGDASSAIAHAQDSYYAFAELNLPLARRLTASAAMRYERYPGIGSVATPKLGLILSPTGDLDMKASWGKSFRAPTLYQQYQPQFAYLVAASSLGGTAYPATATALLSLGGNAALKPERSTNWSATLDLHPRAMRGFDLSLSYFSIDYRDRIVTPILFTSDALSNPAYAQFVTLAPSAAQQAAFLAAAASFTNVADGPYDPAGVAGIVRNASVNAGRQRVRGIDAMLAYKTSAGQGEVNTSLALSWLDSDQQLSADQPVTQLAGILFNPPHLKGRGELGYTRGGFSVTGDVTYIGPVRDTRAAVPVRVAGMTPIDLTLRYRTGGQGMFGGLDLILSAQNVFDEMPHVIATSLFYDTPYDSTNYSPVGRVISLSVSKKW